MTPGDEHAAVVPPLTRSRLWRFGLFFAAIYFVQGMVEPGAGIASEPVFFLLKDKLLLSAAQTAAFLAIVSVAWNIKPLYGLVSDFFPLFGYRRKSYLLVTTGFAAAGWLALGLMSDYAYSPALVLLTLCGLGLAFSDVLCDAIMVETGKRYGLTGRFQAVQWGAANAAGLLAGIGGGWLAQNVSYRHTFLLVSAFPLLALLATALSVRERRSKFDRESLRETGRAIRTAFRSRVLWTAVAFLFLWDFSPSFGVPLDYFLVDRLGVSKMFLGTLDSIDAVGAILGAFLYGKCCQGVSIRKLLYVSVAIGAASTFSFWGLVGFKTAAALTFINGVVAMVANLATFDLAARSCPDRAEGTFFAALMSVANLGAAGSGFVGGWLYERIGLSPLIMVSGLATLACALIIPLIRLDGKEAQAAQGRT